MEYRLFCIANLRDSAEVDTARDVISAIIAKNSPWAYTIIAKNSPWACNFSESALSLLQFKLIFSWEREGLLS